MPVVSRQGRRHLILIESAMSPQGCKPSARDAVIGIGAGGHAKVVIDALQAQGRAVFGLIDAGAALWGRNVLGIPVLGGDELLSQLWTKGVRQAFIGVGTARNTVARSRIWQQLHNLKFDVIDVVHPAAVMSRYATLGRGITVLARAVINAEAVIDDNVIINTAAVVEHDCRIGDHVHLATGCVLAGGVIVETGAFVGAGAILKPGVRIGPNSVVGAGAVVVHDVPPNVVVSGVPARIHDTPVPVRETPCAIRIAS